MHYDGTEWVDVTTSLDTAANVICGSATSLSPFAIARPLPVVVDIKPGTYPNSINLGSGGTVPVAILTTATFDAANVNPMTVTLASAPVKLKGNGTPMSSLDDTNGDGLLDLVVHVVTSALTLSAADKPAELVGTTFDGRRIHGTDSVRVVP